MIPYDHGAHCDKSAFGQREWLEKRGPMEARYHGARVLSFGMRMKLGGLKLDLARREAPSEVGKCKFYLS